MPENKPKRALRPIAPPTSPELIAADLQHCEVMIDSSPDRADKGLRVYRALGREIPNLLQEIGRVREETFRTVGEGSGLERDLDAFDEYYDHFISWDKGEREITGAYRIGRVDEILKARGPKGLYTTTLFELESLLESDFREGTLEVGRSFVRTDYQRGLSLLYIWMAFAQFILQRPHYRHMMGPVSISNDFHETSKHLMVEYLMKNHPHEKSEMVKSLNPPTFASTLGPEELTDILDASMNLSELQEFVRRAEGDPKAKIPQLIKLYLELGVRFLAFNKDDDFNTIDGLIWLDLTEVPENVGLRYFGEGWAGYLKYHGKS